jgi:hypothetical protein
MSFFKQRAGEKSNYRLMGSARRETTRFDEVLALNCFLIK